MFATLLGDLPRPPLPADAAPNEIVYFALEAQATAGLEPLTDGGLWGDEHQTDPVERWRATAALTNRAVKAVVPGPYSAVEPGPDHDDRLAAAADATNATLRALAAAGCLLAEVHEPGAPSIGADPDARRRFATTSRRALDGVTGIHRSLAIVRGAADGAGVDTILAAPWDVFLSTLITLGSGTPYNLDDQRQGGGINERRFSRNGGRPEQFDFIVPNAWAYRSVDLRAEKQFVINGRQRVGISFEGVNVFSFDNFSEYDGFLPTPPNTNPMYGRPRNVLDPGRRLQFGLRYGF